MWNIYGKQYNLNNYLHKHPGGSIILLACKGNDDCTAAFESYHSMANKEKILNIMNKFEIKKIENLDSYNNNNNNNIKCNCIIIILFLVIFHFKSFFISYTIRIR